VDAGRNHKGDDGQRMRLAHILRDPASYYADARRQAHEHARRVLAARLAAHDVQPATRA
jgi:hypothetical protein